MERSREIQSLFQEALQRDPAERDAWLRKARHGAPVYSVKSGCCSPITMKPPASSPGPRQQRRSSLMEPLRCKPASAWIPTRSWRPSAPAAWVKYMSPRHTPEARRCHQDLRGAVQRAFRTASEGDCFSQPPQHLPALRCRAKLLA